MGQRALLFVFRTSAVMLVLGGVLFLGGWKLGKLMMNPEDNVWARAFLDFSFRVGVSWLAAGVVAPILLGAIRRVPTGVAEGERRPSEGSGGVTAMMPAFMALLALLAVASSGPLITWWREGLALLDRLEAWAAIERGGEGWLALLGVAGVLFVPVVGSATVLSFLSGSATAPLFRSRGRRFVRIYAAWIVIHAALVLTLVYSGYLLGDLSGPWLEELRLEAEDAENPDEAVPADALAYLEDWIPATVARTSSLATRATWISLAYAAWLPLLLFAPREGLGPRRRGSGVRLRRSRDG